MGELENNYWIKKFNLLIDRNESNYSSGAARSRNSTLLNGEEATSLHKKSFNSSNEIRKCRNVYRDPFILDRDRILYSRAFKRLSRKTQLFAPEKRIVENRLTHTLKVAQLARSICHGLCLNENLAESISYGHDVGHPPFGHTGERSIQRWVDEKIKLINVEYEQMHLSGDLPEGLLSKITKDKQPSVQSHFIFGTDKEEKLFMHGRQSFKLLALFEKDRTMKLTRETCFGIWRHSRENIPTDKDFYFPCDDTFVHPHNPKLEYKNIGLSPNYLTLETQTVRYADDIAWVVTGLEEGIRVNMIDPDEISDILYKKTEEEPSPNQVLLLEQIRKGEYEKLLTYFVS